MQWEIWASVFKQVRPPVPCASTLSLEVGTYFRLWTHTTSARNPSPTRLLTRLTSELSHQKPGISVPSDTRSIAQTVLIVKGQIPWTRDLTPSSARSFEIVRQALSRTFCEGE